MASAPLPAGKSEPKKPRSRVTTTAATSTATTTTRTTQNRFTAVPIDVMSTPDWSAPDADRLPGIPYGVWYKGIMTAKSSADVDATLNRLRRAHGQLAGVIG